MKMTKKFFAAALAVAALSLVGCNMNEDEYGILDFDAPNGVCTIDYTNENEFTSTDTKYIRGWATFNSGRASANCLITFTNQTSTTKGGNLGLIFNITENDDDSYNFCVATLQKDGKNGTRTYISYFENIGAQYLSSGSNFADVDGIPAGKGGKATETHIVPSTDGWKESLPNCDIVDGKISVFMELTFDPATGYSIGYYAPKVDGKKTVADKDKVIMAPVSITNGLDKDEDDPSIYVTPNAGIGAYAMVIPQQTLTGTWNFFDIKGNAIPLELAD